MQFVLFSDLLRVELDARAPDPGVLELLGERFMDFEAEIIDGAALVLLHNDSTSTAVLPAHSSYAVR